LNRITSKLSFSERVANKRSDSERVSFIRAKRVLARFSVLISETGAPSDRQNCDKLKTGFAVFKVDTQEKKYILIYMFQVWGMNLRVY